MIRRWEWPILRAIRAACHWMLDDDGLNMVTVGGLWMMILTLPAMLAIGTNHVWRHGGPRWGLWMLVAWLFPVCAGMLAAIGYALRWLVAALIPRRATEPLLEDLRAAALRDSTARRGEKR